MQKYLQRLEILAKLQFTTRDRTGRPLLPGRNPFAEAFGVNQALLARSSAMYLSINATTLSDLPDGSGCIIRAEIVRQAGSQPEPSLPNGVDNDVPKDLVPSSFMLGPTGAGDRAGNTKRGRKRLLYMAVGNIDHFVEQWARVIPASCQTGSMECAG
jgi:hypothetical protein